MAALRAAVFPLSAKNRRGGHFLPPPPVRVLRQNTDIVIRKADKSQIYVILDADDYHRKCKVILDDPTKFKRITRNPVEQLKRDANSLIDAANKHTNGTKLTRITGEYKPDYFYGNVKTQI